MLDKQIIAINNLISKLRRRRVKPENILLVFPHCLQWSGCQQNIVQDLANCKRCGKCQICDLLELQERLGTRCHVASGGRQAVAMVKQNDIKVVVAVACEKELRSGILATIPKPIIAIPNEQPCGPCKDTRVNMESVEKAIRQVTAAD
jgi:hypothetical protein